MLIIILSWIVLFLLVFGLGHLIMGKIVRIFHLKDKIYWFEYFWMGLAGVIAILQVWSIFLPVDGYTLLFIAAISGLRLVHAFRGSSPFNREKITKFAKINKTFFLTGIFILLAISLYATQNVTWPDTLLYHLGAVKWSNTFAAVPGLANLHSRLGFNSSFFLFASMVEGFFLKDASVHVAMSLLISVLSLEILWILLRKNNLHLKYFCLFIIPFIFREITGDGVVPSFSTDFALVVIVVSGAIEFFLGNTKALFIAGVMACLAFTIKLSGLVFSAAMFLFAAGGLIAMNKRHKTRVALVLLISGGLLIVPYIVRNIILSGWPLYPIPIFGVDVPWTVAESQVRSLSSVIHAWAINPGPSWSKYIEVDFLEWVPVWFARNSGNWDVRIFFAGCLLLLLSPLAGVYKKMSPAFKKPLFLLTAASLINVFYVLFTAPDTRFGAIFIWMFFSAAVTPYAIFLISKGRSFRSYIIAAWLILLIVISYPIIFKNTYSIWTVPKESSRPTTEVQVKGSGVKDQFYILKPTQGNLCGNSGFMCTPESNEIRELVPGEIAKGFGPVN